MADEPDNLVLVYLRRIDAKIDRVVGAVRELRDRMVAVEQQTADTRREILNLAATEASHYASLSSRMDRLGDRVDRIGRQLDIAEA